MLEIPIKQRPQPKHEQLKWRLFCEECAAWAAGLGAQLSLTQTKWLSPGLHGVELPRELTRSRFLTSFYEQFVV